MKKAYEKPQMKEFKLNHHASLLSTSDLIPGEVGYNGYEAQDRKNV